MHEDLERLIALHDIEQLLVEIESEEYLDLGFKVKEKRKSELNTAKNDIVEKLPPNVYRRYQRLKEKFGRGIAPVVGGICMNCFVQLPTAAVGGTQKNLTLENCSNCGIYIYWV